MALRRHFKHEICFGGVPLEACQDRGLYSLFYYPRAKILTGVNRFADGGSLQLLPTAIISNRKNRRRLHGND